VNDASGGVGVGTWDSGRERGVKGLRVAYVPSYTIALSIKSCNFCESDPVLSAICKLLLIFFDSILSLCSKESKGKGSKINE
jgi:hypothetical protein